MSSSKRKGTRFEQDVVRAACGRGLTAVRAKGSNGRSIGRSTEVDVVIEDLPFQLKRKERFPEWAQVKGELKGVMYRQDHGPPMALIPLSRLLDLLAKVNAPSSSD